MIKIKKGVKVINHPYTLLGENRSPHTTNIQLF